MKDQRYFEFEVALDRTRLFSVRCRDGHKRQEHLYRGLSPESASRFCRAVRRRPESFRIAVYPTFWSAEERR